MDRAIPFTIFAVSTFSVAQSAIAITQFKSSGKSLKSTPGYSFSVFMIILSGLVMLGALWYTVHPHNTGQQKIDILLAKVEQILGTLESK